MKPLIPILVVATTSLAVASVQFGQQASQQRKRADAEQVLRQKQDARIAELERSQSRLENDLQMARAQAAATPPPVVATSQPPAGPRPPPPSVNVAATADGPGPGAPPRFNMRPGRGPLDSPAGRKFMESRIKNSLRRQYGDVGTAMGLSAEKGNQLLDLLTDQLTRNMGRPPAIPDGMTPQQYVKDQQQKNSDEVKALIGADKMADWTAYQKSLPDRMQVNSIRDQLDQAGLPMTDSQRTEMLAAVTEESQRLPRPTLAAGTAPEDGRAQMSQWQTEYDKALLDRAKQVLNPEQYSAYKEYQDWQTEIRNSLPRGPGGGGNAVFSTFVGGNPALQIPAGGTVVLQTTPPVPAQATPRR
jgi:hypothetical protein